MCPPSAYRPMSTSSPRTATAEVRFAATRLIGRSTHTLLFPIALRRFAHPSRHARNELPTIAMGRRHHPLRCLRTRPMTTNPYNNHEPVQQLRTRQTTTNPFNDFGPLRRRRTCPTTTNPSGTYESIRQLRIHPTTTPAAARSTSAGQSTRARPAHTGRCGAAPAPRLGVPRPRASK